MAGINRRKIFQCTRQRVVDAQTHGWWKAKRQGVNGLPLRYNQTQYIAPSESDYFVTDSKGSMKYARFSIRNILQLLTIATVLLCATAHADDYAEVSQLVRAGKFADANAKADQFLAGKPKDPQMRFLKGVIQRDSGKTSDAIITFTRLTEDFPELPEPYNNLAVLYASQSQFDKARTSLEMAIRTNPSYATAHENLGDVYAKLASQAYNKALQLDNGNQGVPPKLALIRELFNPGAKGQRPTAVVAPQQSAQTPAKGGAPAATASVKPPPTLPTPAAARPVSTPSVGIASAPVAPAVIASAAKPVATVTAPDATPVPAPAPTAAPSANAGREVEAAVQAWATAWAAKDVRAYLASYGKDFDPPGNQKRSAWEEERKQRILGKSKISVKVEGLSVKVEGTKATAKFRQDYRADGVSKGTRKVMELIKTGDRWLIVRESTGN